jgi:hypothetical protein
VAPRSVLDCLHILGAYANAGIDSIELARAVVEGLNADNCYAAYELASSLGLRGLSRAALDVIQTEFASNTRDYIVSLQSQLNGLKKAVTLLTDRVETLETGGNRVSEVAKLPLLCWFLVVASLHVVAFRKATLMTGETEALAGK